MNTAAALLEINAKLDRLLAIVARQVEGSLQQTGPIDPGALYSVATAAPLVGMHPGTLRGKLRDGLILGKRRHGGTWRVRGAELLKLG